MKPFKSIILAVAMFAVTGAVQARDEIDDITMRVMEDMVKEDKGRGVRYLELPRPASNKGREAQERGQPQSQERDKERKREGRGEQRRGDNERHGDGRKGYRDDERDSRGEDRHDDRDAVSAERSDERDASMDTEENGADDRD